MRTDHLPAKVSPRVSERRPDSTVPDYPPNNRVSAKEVVRTINTASAFNEEWAVSSPISCGGAIRGWKEDGSSGEEEGTPREERNMRARG
ncbi:hypothetical protein PAMP_019264 [Pampus punctatissimus]